MLVVFLLALCTFTLFNNASSLIFEIHFFVKFPKLILLALIAWSPQKGGWNPTHGWSCALTLRTNTWHHFDGEIKDKIGAPLSERASYQKVDAGTPLRGKKSQHYTGKDIKGRRASCALAKLDQECLTWIVSKLKKNISVVSSFCRENVWNDFLVLPFMGFSSLL